MKKGLLILGLALLTAIPMSAQRAVFVGRGFYGGGFYGGYWGGPYGYGPYPYGYVAYPASGNVKIDTKVKDAQVFINGAYAGTTHENKTMHLRPGSYKLEIREAGTTRYSQQVYVAVGKTLHVHPEL